VTRQLILSREARADIAEAIAWLRDRSPALPRRFRTELESVLTAALTHPDMYPVVYRRFHRALLSRFPYSVFYVVDPGALVIIGVVHQARDESTWKHRA
jgi:plasmid stabilization system protein ParE